MALEKFSETAATRSSPAGASAGHGILVEPYRRLQQPWPFATVAPSATVARILLKVEARWTRSISAT